MGTIGVSIILFIIISLKIVNMIKNKKKGKPIIGCSCGCESCPSAPMCHGK